jgi:hypothetical protein
MAIRKIYYEVRNTSASTDYLDISPDDKAFVIEQLIKIQSYVNEIALIKHKDAKEVINWFNHKTKTLPYNNILKTQNTPLSFVSGLANNLVFGNQEHLSLTQAQHLENIISTFVTFADAINLDLKIQIQKNTTYDSILFVENLFKVEI